MDPPGSDRPRSRFRSELRDRLLDERRIVVNEALTARVAGQITERLAVLDGEAAEPIQMMMSAVPGGDVEAGLSMHDLLRSLTAPVTVLASGRISGAGVVALAGAAADRRFGLPHARFQLQEPTDSLYPGPASDLEGRAKSAADRRRRVVKILSEATGQSSEQIESDLSKQRTFKPEEAARYGLITRVVESRDSLT